MRPWRTHTHQHTHFKPPTPCFLSLLKEFQPSLLSSWEDSSFPFLSLNVLSFPVLSFSFTPLSLLSVEFAEVTVVQLHVFHLWFDGYCPRSHQNKFFPYLLLFSSSYPILVRVGRAHFSSLMDHFANKLNNAVLSCQRRKEHYILSLSVSWKNPFPLTFSFV